MQLTPEEVARYTELPVYISAKYNLYLFPPFKNGVMRLAALSTGYTGVPRLQSDFPTDGIPAEAEEHLRRGLREVMPALAKKEFFDVRVCWCVDTPDMDFLVTEVPDKEELYVATGGSAHGFKFLPVIGRYIALMVEGRLPREVADKWRWKTAGSHGQGRHTGKRNVLEGKPLEETHGWSDSARHGTMRHTWDN
jgi:glycine/D-amino acid oxidase-like deaminating enzyme